MTQITDHKFKFSVVTAVYNIKPFLAEAIESLIAQDIGFTKNIQLILVDDGSTDGSGEVCDHFKEQYPDNILVIHKENGGVSSARNTGLKYVEGEYVNFMDGDDKLSSNSLSIVYRYFKLWNDIELISIPIKFFDGQDGEHILNYKFNKGSRIIELLKEYNCPQMSISSAFIPAEIAKKITFDYNLQTAEDVKAIIQLFLSVLRYGVVCEASYLYRRRTSGFSSAIQESAHSKAWYTNYMEYFCNWCIEESKKCMGCVPRFVQYTLMYDLQWKYKIAALPTHILSSREIDIYISNLSRVIKSIDDAVIMEQRNISIEYKFFILKQKHGCNPKLLVYPNDILYYYNETQVYKHSQLMVRIEFIRMANHHLEIEGSTVFFGDDPGKVKCYLKVGNDLIACKTTKRKDRTQSLGKTIGIRIGFSATVTLKDKEGYRINIIHEINGVYVEMKRLSFGKFSPLQAVLWNSYYTDKKHLLMYDYNTLVVHPYCITLHVYREMSYLKALLKENTSASKKAFILRCLYALWNIFPHKDIWIITDRIYKGDDNGEALFRYIQKHPDSRIKCYFAILKNCDDFKRMQQYGKVIPFGGWLYKWYHICGAKIISSHGEDEIFHPLQNSTIYYEDLIQKSHYIFLQHGITKDDISGWLNRFNKNISVFVTATRPEWESILKYDYYYNENVVKLTGFPRHDYLYHNEQRKITFMPTWRKYLMINNASSVTRKELDQNFKTSNFFNMYSSLLNHPKLIDAAKKFNYSLQLKVHPDMVCTLPYLSLNPCITIVPLTEPYKKVFAESDLIITDYSSVAFDFAYLRKTVLYYQADREEFFSGGHVYTKGYFDYEKNGFGEVEYTLDSMVDRIIEYMENNCTLKEKYAERIDATFPFSDTDNCKRVYDEIKQIGSKINIS